MPDVHVYLLRIQETNYFKVGISSNVAHRLAELNTATPYLIEVIETYAQPNAYETEQQIHKMLAGMHVRREWFQGDPAEILRIFRIGNTMGIIDAATDEEVVPSAAQPRFEPIPSTPTIGERTVAFLTDSGEWMTATKMAAALGIGLQVMRTEMSKLARYGDVIKRPCVDKNTRDTYEYAVPYEVTLDQEG